MEQHHDAVSKISERVKSFYKNNVPFRVYHGSTNSTRLLSHDPDKVVNTSPLSHVISIDKERRVAVVEPNVPMDQLVSTTLKHGLIPQVIPEFPGITVGGSYSGTAAESSSFKYGYFDRSVNWVEMVIANGDVVTASADENSDLFYGAVGACGTLGVATLFEVQLITGGKYVQLTYLPVHSSTEAISVIDKSFQGSWDYVDGIMFSQELGVIVLGRITDERLVDSRVVRFTRPWDPWFYLHAHKQVAHLRDMHCETCEFVDPRMPWEDGNTTELVPIQDYFFRYDRGSFWMGSYGWPSWLFNRLGRFLLDYFLRTRVMYKAMHHSGRSQTFIIQDLAIPKENAQKFLDWVHKSLHIYPVWLCPVRADTNASLHRANRPVNNSISTVKTETSRMVTPNYTLNIGVWGLKTADWPQLTAFKAGPDKFQGFIADNRSIEAKVQELGGLKWLYAHNYYTEDEFWRVYDKQEYDRLRGKWGASTLPSLWDKMKRTRNDYFDGSLRKAVLLTVIGKNHLLAKKK